MAYGDNCNAFQMINKSQREIAGAAIEQNGETFTFQDKSFIELNKWDHRKAFLSNGWCVANV